MAKDPAFLFYSADFMIGTMLLTMSERGQYITLICIMHQRGRLTKNEMKIVLHEDVSENVLEKFKKDSENKYYNERLETEQNKRKEFSESRRRSLNINNGDLVHLYIIKDPLQPVYKIGSSKYPYLRIKEVVKYKPGADFFWISTGLFERINEKKLHEKYAHKKEKYDWFFLDSKDLEDIVREFRTEDENAIGNENVNDNKREDENFGKSENLLLVPKMFEVFKKNNPTYLGSVERDYKPLLSIANFFCEIGKLQGSPDLHKDKILEVWGLVSKVISKDDFYKQKSLSTISNQIQAITQKSLNGESTTKNGKQNYGTPERLDKLNRLFAERYRSGGSTTG